MMKRIALAGLFLATVSVAGGAQAVPPKKAAAPVAAPARDWVAGDVTKAVSQKYQEFLAACKTSHIDENCSFLKSAFDYATQKDAKRRGVLAEQIMHFYLGQEAKQEINLPGAKANKLTAAYAAAKKSKSYPAGMFDEAAKEITALMVTNINQSNRAAFAPVLKALK